jgi:hypothetical protein
MMNEEQKIVSKISFKQLLHLEESTQHHRS